MQLGVIEPTYYVDPTACVHPTARIGAGTKIWGNAYVGRNAVIGESCIIARNVEVGPNVVIGDRCKLESGCQVHEGWVLGDGVFIGPQAVLCNDNDPKAVRTAENPFTPLAAVIEDEATVCANATLIAGLTIGARAKVWPGAVVTRDVPAGGRARCEVATLRNTNPSPVHAEQMARGDH